MQHRVLSLFVNPDPTQYLSFLSAVNTDNDGSGQVSVNDAHDDCEDDNTSLKVEINKNEVQLKNPVQCITTITCYT